jgi:acetate kinase
MGPGVPQVAVFDTGFHSTMPETSYLYAIPYPRHVAQVCRIPLPPADRQRP